jgi:hypothetical protein
MTTLTKTCANDDCSFKVDGKCVEGYLLVECPHLSGIAVDEAELVFEPEPTPVETKIVALDLGEALSRAQASSLQSHRTSRVVGVIGSNDAGKTSLLASVYDLLQQGSIGGMGFAGSATLIGFEKVCHDARAASRRDAPHTARTTQGSDATFFHLDLRAADSEIVSLFVADRSGEDYLAALDDLSTAAEFFELRRADVVALLVNGEHLASSENRHEAKAVAPQIIEALVEAQSLRPGCRLAIVLTKNDSVIASPNAQRTQREFDKIVDEIVTTNGAYLGQIDRFVISASPKDLTKVKRGDGVSQLLEFWLRPNTPPIPVAAAIPKSARIIDLLDIGRGHA